MNVLSARYQRALWFEELKKSLDFLGIAYKDGYKNFTISKPPMAKLKKMGVEK